MNANDRTEILEMLAQGKITAREAMALLDQAKAPQADAQDPVTVLKDMEANDLSIEEIKVSETQDVYASKPVKPENAATTLGDGQKARWLKIRVEELSTGRRRVSVSLPLGLVSFGLGVARRFGADMSDFGPVEPEALLAALREGEQGVLVDVEDEEDNERVQIYLE
jgi:hypothetical protein